jgi:hypothetical protein
MGAAAAVVVLAVAGIVIAGRVDSRAASTASNRATTSPSALSSAVDSSSPPSSVKSPPDFSSPRPVTGTPQPAQPPQHAVASSGPDGDRILTAATVAQLGMPLPFTNETMDLSTAYWTVVSNDYLNIYTGSSPSDNTQGIVIVRSHTGDSFTSPIAQDGIFTENGTGALTITAVNGVTVTMRDQSGGTHSFNVTTDAFSQA